MAVATPRDARAGLPDWAWGLLVMAGIVLLSRLSDVASLTGLPIKPWKPGAGFAFGMLLARGLHLLPWVLLGQASAILAASLAAGVPPDWDASIAGGFAASLGLGIAADHLRRRMRIDLALSRLGDVLRLLAVALALAPAISALEVLAFVAIGPLREAEAPVGFLRLCVGNLIGMAVVTPIILRLHAPGLSRLRAVGGVRVLEIAALCGALLVLAWYIFGIKETDEFKLFDLLFLPMVAFAVRYGLDGALAGLALTQVAMMGWLRWHDFPAAGVVELQTLFFILAATCIFVGIVVDERERAGAALRANEKLLREQDAQLARVMRLDAIGEMASTLSHEITQPLTAVRAPTSATASLRSTSPRGSSAASGSSSAAASRIASRSTRSPWRATRSRWRRRTPSAAACASCCTRRRCCPPCSRTASRSSRSCSTCCATPSRRRAPGAAPGSSPSACARRTGTRLRSPCTTRDLASPRRSGRGSSPPSPPRARTASASASPSAARSWRRMAGASGSSARARMAPSSASPSPSKGPHDAHGAKARPPRRRRSRRAHRARQHARDLGLRGRGA